MLVEKVLWVHHWSDRTFSFKTTRSSTFKFFAGEFVLIGLNIGGKNVLRAYSIVSPPWADYLEFLSIKIPHGQLTSKLQDIKLGDEVLIAPKTSGTLRNEALNTGKVLWLFATGTGLAPFMSLVRDLDTLERWGQINLVHSVRDRSDLAYYNDLNEGYKNSDIGQYIVDKLNYIKVVTGEGMPRITDCLDERIVVNTDTEKIMICGNIQFNKEMAKWCIGKEMKEGSLREPGDFVVERAFVEK